MCNWCSCLDRMDLNGTPTEKNVSLTKWADCNVPGNLNKHRLCEKHKFLHNIFCGAFRRVEQTGTIHILRRRRKKRTRHACIHRCLNHVQFTSTYEGGQISNWQYPNLRFVFLLTCSCYNPDLCTLSEKKIGIGSLLPCSVNPTLMNISLEETIIYRFSCWTAYKITNVCNVNIIQSWKHNTNRQRDGELNIIHKHWGSRHECSKER